MKTPSLKMKVKKLQEFKYTQLNRLYAIDKDSNLTPIPRVLEVLSKWYKVEIPIWKIDIDKCEELEAEAFYDPNIKTCGFKTFFPSVSTILHEFIHHVLYLRSKIADRVIMREEHATLEHGKRQVEQICYAHENYFQEALKFGE